MNFIKVNASGTGFEDSQTGDPFVPIGVNYAAAQNIAKYKNADRRFTTLFGVDQYTLDDPVEEARKWFHEFKERGFNFVRCWIEPQLSMPYGPTLDDAFVRQFDALLDICRETGIRLTLGCHIAGVCTGWDFQNSAPPFDQFLDHHYRLMAMRYGDCPEIFSWSIVGEGQMPWYTAQLHKGWPTFLQYQYNDDIQALKKAWGSLPGVNFRTWEDAPVPPRNIGAALGVTRVLPSKLDELPEDPYAGSTWRYDWRLYLETVGSQRVVKEVSQIKQAGAKQMFTVGANSFSFPNTPAGCMSMGFCPLMYRDSVDYLCQHNYPMPQCQDGGDGDPMTSTRSMQRWLAANQIMGRMYTSMGKPVVLEEWSWMGDGEDKFAGATMAYCSEEDQATYGNAMMEATSQCFAGWAWWMHRDMPYDADLTRTSGLYKTDGSAKVWATGYSNWAKQFQQTPPTLAPAKTVIDVPLVDLFTDDRAHELWWQNMMDRFEAEGPFDFRYVMPRKPMMDFPTDVRGLEIVDSQVDVWAQEG